MGEAKYDKKGATDKNTVSDRGAKTKAANIIKEESSEKFVNIDARGTSIDECPLVPMGPRIFLKYNLAENTKVIGISNNDRKPLKPYFTVIGKGATVKSVDIGDRLMVKPDAAVNTFDTGDYKSDEIPAFKYHAIYEYDIENLLK